MTEVGGENVVDEISGLPADSSAVADENNDVQVEDDAAVTKVKKRPGRPRGRPKVTKSKAVEEHVVFLDPASFPKRSSRRAAAKKTNYRKLNESGRDHSDEDIAEAEDDRAVHDIAEVLDGDFSADFETKVDQKKGLKDDSDTEEIEDSDEDLEYRDGTSGAQRKRGRKRRIKVEKYQAKIRKREEKVREKDGITRVKEEDSYFDCKELICVACCKELDPEKMDTYKNIYSDVTAESGKSLYDMFSTLVGQDVQPTFYGSRLCPRCYSAMNMIESHYHTYRRAVDAFMDRFQLGQRLLDADTCAAGEDVAKADSLAAFVKMSKITMKVIDPGASSFNSLAIAQDFSVPVEKIYKGSVVNSTELLPDPDPEQTPENPDNGVITLTFDASTGIIEKTVSMGPGEITEEAMDRSLPVLYLSQDEFSALSKSVSKSIVHWPQEEFDALQCRLFLGTKVKQQILLSKTVSEAYQRQSPGSDSTFSCSDCSASYQYFHMLANHIQVLHKADKEEKKSAQDASQGALDAGHRTGEVATVDKPFQCEHCDKCFTEYLTLSTHVDHYHGFQRRCNVEGCEAAINSIQEYVQHYVSHADPNFKMPEDFKEKIKLNLPCPICNITVQGVWKYFQHTYTHDREPRFRCPVCGKRTHKVQNFKDHLYRHKFGSAPGAATAAKNAKAAARNELLLNSGIPPIENKHPVQLHMREALTNPVDSAVFQCMDCDNRETSLVSARKHFRQVHQDKPFTCNLCKNSFVKESDLHLHLIEEHAETVGGNSLDDGLPQPCTFCGMKFKKSSLRLRHTRYMHLTDTIDIRDTSDKEVVEVVGDHIAELDAGSGNIIKLHSIP